MSLSEARHRETGLSFQEWLEDPDGLPAKEPMGLVEIRDAFNAAFNVKPLPYGEFLEGLRLCIAALVQRGLRPMLPNYQTGKWEWTDLFNGFARDDDTPAGIAEMAIASWVGWGDSGGAEHLRFGTRLQDGPLPAPNAYYPAPQPPPRATKPA